MNADPVVMEHFPALLTREESDAMVDRIRKFDEENGFCFWAVEIPGVAPFAGFTGLARPRFEAHFTPCVEIGWRLATEFHGKGYATEGAMASLQFGFDVLKLEKIYSFTVPANRNSWRVMEKIGMEYEGEFLHPAIADDSPLKKMVLYKKMRKE